ncbi:MAG: hypothetical protein ACKOYM_02840 [Actinomycetes bacterium]
MIASVVGVLIGVGVGAALWATTGSIFAVDALQRTNFRGRSLPTAVGVLVPVSVLFVAGVSRVALLAAERSPSWDQLLGATLVGVIGFGLLGALDDVAGVGQSGGFRGHLRSAMRGELTSGMVKLLGGAALGVLVAAPMATGDGTLVSALRDGAVVALAANLANLFDRAPGRAIKVTSVGFVVAALVAQSSTLAAPAVGIGAGLGLLYPDLRERSMLGDAGANPLGAMCGMAALSAASTPTARWLLLVALLGLNALSEVVSFSRVIESVPALRWCDRLGRIE